MKTFLKVAAVAAILLVALPFLLQLRSISVENGETQLLYMPLGGNRPGGSAGMYLREALLPLYGEDGALVETAGQWQGKNVTITDLPRYDIEYLGKVLGGMGDYMEITVTTERTVKDAVSGEELGKGSRIAVCLAYDDGDINSRVRAHVLWDTVREQFYGAGFDAVPVV